jgi:hypothetical protein
MHVHVSDKNLKSYIHRCLLFKQHNTLNLHSDYIQKSAALQNPIPVDFPNYKRL